MGRVRKRHRVCRGGRGWGVRMVFRRRIGLTVYFFYIACWG